LASPKRSGGLRPAVPEQCRPRGGAFVSGDSEETARWPGPRVSVGSGGRVEHRRPGAGGLGTLTGALRLREALSDWGRYQHGRRATETGGVTGTGALSDGRRIDGCRDGVPRPAGTGAPNHGGHGACDLV